MDSTASLFVFYLLHFFQALLSLYHFYDTSTFITECFMLVYIDVVRSVQQRSGSARSLSACGSARQQTRTPRGSRCTPRTSSSATPAADGSAVMLG